MFDAIQQVRQEQRVVERVAGQVDADAQALHRGDPRAEVDQRLVDHPAVDAGHQVEALGGRDEGARRSHLAIRIVQSQQQLVVPVAVAAGADRDDLLRLQLEAVVLQGLAQPAGEEYVTVLALHFLMAELVHRNPVAPGMLGRVAGHVGLAHQFAGAARGGGKGGDTDARAHVVEPPFPGEAHRADLLDELARHLLRLRQVAIEQQQAELIAAQPRQGVGGAGAVGENPAQLAQQHVARRVPGGIVDHLEAVEVDEAQRMLGRPLLGVGQGALQLLLELGAVEQPGEGIVGGVIAQLTLHRPGLGDVLEHQHGADDLAIAGAHRRRAILDIVLLALAADQRGAVLQVEHPGVLQAASHRAFQGLAGVAVEHVEDQFVGRADGVLQGPAGHRLGHRVHEGHAAAGVGGQHGIADGIQGHLQAFLFLVQGFRQGADLGDVAVDADHPHRTVVLVARQRGDRPQVANLAVGADDTELAVEFLQPADGALQLAQHAVVILGMQARLPLLHRGLPGTAADAVQVEHAEIPVQAVARQVPLPDADLPGVGGQLDPFGEALALQLGTLATVDILHLGDEVLGDSLLVAHQRHADARPEGFAVLAQVALLHLVGVDTPGEQVAHQVEVQFQVVHIGDLLERQLAQAFGGIAEHPAQRLVDLEQPPLQRHQGHADRREFHGAAELRLADGHLMLLAAAALHDHRDQEGGNEGQGHRQVQQRLAETLLGRLGEEHAEGDQHGDETGVQATDQRGTEHAGAGGGHQQRQEHVDEGVGQARQGHEADHQGHQQEHRVVHSRPPRQSVTPGRQVAGHA